MGKGILIYLLLIIGGFFLPLIAQEKENREATPKSLVVKDSLDANNAVSVTGDIPELEISNTEFKPNSTKAVIYSAILPGLGQIYNRKYWKLPIVYGGFMGVVYGFTWNNRYYQDYTDAYSDWVNRVEGGAWQNFKPNLDLSNPSEYDSWERIFRRKKDYYRRYRDLSIIIGVGLYALCMIDAYVDAQLYNFDMSPDLSMQVEPIVWGPTPTSKMAAGIQCRITF